MRPVVIAAATLCVCALPAAVRAQTTVDGSAEWTVASNTSTSNSQSNDNSSFWQNYALGLTSSLFDPRIVKFNTEGLFRTSSLTSGGANQPDQEGKQADVGYKVGASVLPASAFPFFVQASRTTSNSSGDLGPSNPIRSGMIAPSGAPPIDFESLNSTLTLGWQVNTRVLPRVDLGYRKGSAIVTGGGYRAEQSDDDLSAGASKDTARTRQSFRYQKTNFENVLATTFLQRLSNLDYDLGVLVTPHTRLTAHGGRRTTFAQSEFASTLVDPASGPYTPPPALGAAGVEYLMSGIDFEPGRRFSARLHGTVDRQMGEQATTSARLVSGSSHVEVVRGLVVTGIGTHGTRGQIVGTSMITVATENASAGATYQTGFRWVSGRVGATRGIGTNVTPEGARGTSDSWSSEASLSLTFGWLGLGTGYDRIDNRDTILDYGNFQSERVRASVQAGGRRGNLSLDGEQLRITRGLLDTLAHNDQRTFSGSASLRLWRETLVTASAGGFVNDYDSVAIGVGRDQTLYWGAAAQTVIRSALRASAWIRSEDAIATRTGFDQNALSTFARLEYRLRTLSLGAEYRNNHSLLHSVARPIPDTFIGRQFRFTVIRQFGFRLS